MYWIMLRNSEDQDAEGYWRRMEKYSGPFANEEEARDKAWDLNQKQKQYALERSIPELRKEALKTSYTVFSDEQIESFRRSGMIDIE